MNSMHLGASWNETDRTKYIRTCLRSYLEFAFLEKSDNHIVDLNLNIFNKCHSITEPGKESCQQGKNTQF